MAYKMFLNGLLMPVCPGKVTVKVNGQNKTMNLLNGEEINLLKTPGLSDVSFELLLPHRAYPFSSSVFCRPATTSPISSGSPSGTPASSGYSSARSQAAGCCTTPT